MTRTDSSLLQDALKLDAACANAMELQLAGQPDLAGQLYRAILDAAPKHAAANYCLGMLHVQAHKPFEGLPYLKAALSADLKASDYWLGYMEALILAGRAATARNIFTLGLQHGLAGKAVEDFKRRLEAIDPQAPSPNLIAHGHPRSSRGRPYIVLAPAYDHRSAGVRVMHSLCEELNLCGHTAHLILYQFRAGVAGPSFYTPAGDSAYCAQHRHIVRLPASNDIEQFRALIDDAYVVYPEVIQANPLKATRVVRYVLNYPAANGYPMLEEKQDFIVSFLRDYWRNPNFLATLVHDEPLFNDVDTRPAQDRTMDCTYIGKGLQLGDCFKIPGSVHIDRNWPADKESLAIMLRNTRYFLTWDLISQINTDALFCGAIPVVLRLAPFTSAIFDTDFGPVPYAQSHMENGVLKVAYDADEFESMRRRYIGAYKAVARGRTQTVRRLAAGIERHFERSIERHSENREALG